jgi:hypothetical protein
MTLAAVAVVFDFGTAALQFAVGIWVPFSYSSHAAARLPA